MNLLDMLPDFYQNSPEVVDIQRAITAALDRLLAAKDDYVLQLNVNTATWGLALWEATYGINADPSLSYELRRAQIKAKMGGAGTTRLAMIESVAKNYTDGEVAVEEIASEYRFKIKYIDTLDFLPDKKTLVKTIDEIKPAHLDYEIMVAIAALVFLNTRDFSKSKLSIEAPIKEKSSEKFTWNDLDAMDWNFADLDAQDLTWIDINALTPENTKINKMSFFVAARTSNSFAVTLTEE